jgi:hypothetical protein
MYQVRLFAVRHSRAFEWIYQRVEQVMVILDPVFRKIGYEQIERPVALAEKCIKTVLFDCKMCGQCVLSSTGMSCPMNCPKNLRNGPCGGVRPGAYCEVKPEMKCVWALAWEGASQMKTGGQITAVLPPVAHNLEGTSSWLRASRERAARMRKTKENRPTGMAEATPGPLKKEPSLARLADKSQLQGRE